MNEPSPRREARRPLSLRLAIFIIAISAPFALAFETLFRRQVLARIFGPNLSTTRELLSPILTRAAWALVGATVVAGLIGIAILPSSLRRAEAAALAAGRSQDTIEREKRAMERIFLLTSIPQAPAILSTFCFTFGALLLPVAVAMAVSTIFVLAQGVVAARHLRRVELPAASI